MARILIFDSEATEDNNGGAVSMALSQNSWVTSQSMRCHGGPGGDKRNVSYEFVLSGNPVGASIDLEWYQTFFNDHPWVNLPVALPPEFQQVFPAGSTPPAMPSTRVFPESGAEYPWAREQIAIAGAAGVIDHYNITRNVAGMAVPAAGQADCRYFPMMVHTLWTRLQIRTTTDLASYPRLRVYAHGSGLTDVAAYTERINKVFSWVIPEE